MACKKEQPLLMIKASTLELGQPLSEGGYGLVYRAEHPRWGTVAFKKLHAQLVKESENLKWKREAEIQSRLDHPNIIKFLALVLEPRFYGLVLEYAEHGEIFDYLEKHKPSWGRKLTMIHDVVLGICYLHKLTPPIIHGDLKSQNILVCEDLNVKICDFGFAQLKEYSKSCSSDKVKQGTVTHLPPEAWSNSSGRKNEAFDVYSIGVCMWEIITVRKPFEGVDPGIIQVYVTTNKRPNLKLIPNEVSEYITALIEMCWSQKVEDRPTSFQIKDAIEKEQERRRRTGGPYDGYRGESSGQTNKMNQNKEADCPNCKHPVDSSAKFCSKCGTGVECQQTTVKCPTCSALLDGGVNFCPHCGTKISGKKVSGIGVKPQKPIKPALFADSSKRSVDTNLVTPKSTEKSAYSAGILDVVKCLNMGKYYPKKLSWLEIATLNGDRDSEYGCLDVLRSLIKLDYRALLTVHLKVDEKSPNNSSTMRMSCNDSSNLFNFASKKTRAQSDIIHPMDVMNVIYNCCDNILLQILMSKLSMCQLSIPLVFPTATGKSSMCLLWSLRSIIPECRTGEETQNVCSLVEIAQPLLTFMRIGELRHSKSKMLNDLLRPSRHNTFFHRDCKNGKLRRQISNGTIEATWFQPSRKGKEKLNKYFCILNLRGDAVEYLEKAEHLSCVSSLIFLMLNVNTLREKQYETYLNSCKGNKAEYVICLIAGALAEAEHMIEVCENCDKYFKANKIRLFGTIANWNEDGLLNEEEWKGLIEEMICKHLPSSVSRTLEEFASSCEGKRNISVDENDSLYKAAFEKTEKILSLLIINEPIDRKCKLLPLQGGHWEKWTKLQKEQHRCKVTMDIAGKFISENDAEQKKERHDQFHIFQNGSEFIKAICAHLSSCCNTTEMQYFLNHLKLRLENESCKILLPLQKKYHMLWNEIQKCVGVNPMENVTQAKSKKELNGIIKAMTNVSLGVEHIFREIGQVYEAVLSENIPDRKLDLEVNKLPSLIANLVIQGMPLELMDGETAFAPVTWLQAVFAEIRRLIGEDKKVYVISVVGIQSSGKSTLLNTMFGLQFAVSAGRCTKGVYCQMIPVDKKSSQVNYDYIMVVDTEGLRAPELQQMSKIHDNELATFVIGLGNTTVVNIKGENSSEMNDILQIVVHALLRIKCLSSVQLSPSCIFIHQNVPAVNADERLKFGQESLLMLLDRVTQAAAEEEKIDGVHKFKQVINYDEYKHAVYLPDLWLGDPPMAPVNSGYSDGISDIKDMIVNEISKQAVPVSIESFSTKIQTLWKAILKESFVFSFKNNEEIRAFLHLDNVFANLMWNYKDKGRELESDFKLEIRCCKNVDKLKTRVLTQIKTQLEEKLTNLELDLKIHFDKSANRDVIEQWRARYMKQLKDFCGDEFARLYRVIDEHCYIRAKLLKNSGAFETFKTEIMQRTMKRAKELKITGKPFVERDLRIYFEEKVWKPMLAILRRPGTVKDVTIAIERELDQSFQPHSELLKKELQLSPLRDLKDFTFDTFPLSIRNDLETLLQKRKPVSRGKTLNVSDDILLGKAMKECIDVFREVKQYVQSLSGEDFQPIQAAQIIRMMSAFFKRYDSGGLSMGINFTHEFQIRFTLYTCKSAANEFIQLRNSYQESNNPNGQIREHKDTILKIFLLTYAWDDDDRRAAEVYATTFTGWIRETIENDLGRFIGKVIIKEDKTFESKFSFMTAILRNLTKKMDFDFFLNYLTDPDVFFTNEVNNYRDSWIGALNQNQQILQANVRKEVDKYLGLLLESFEKSSGVQNNLPDLLKEIRRKLKRRMFHDTSVLESIQINDFGKFIKCLIEKVHNLTAETLQAVTDSLNTCTSTVQILSDKVIGCQAKCPFCQSPCYLSENGHIGDHRALQHYPLGIIGKPDPNTHKLCTYNCQTLVEGDGVFCYNEKDPLTSTEPFQNYRKYYPNWEIQPDRSMQNSIYWKWFMVQFHKQLSEFYQLEPADIPAEWFLVTSEQATRSMDQ